MRRNCAVRLHADSNRVAVWRRRKCAVVRTLVDDFAVLDTNGDQRLDGADAAVTVADDGLILSLTGGSVHLLGVTELSESDLDILITT